MKIKYTIIIFAIGFILITIGSLFKILHLPGANIVLLIGTGTQFVGAVLLLKKILTYPKFKDFLNW